MHAFVITGGSRESRLVWITSCLKQWNVGAYDQVAVVSEDPTIGIAAVRELTRRLILKPFQGDTVVGLIADADRLTVPAQHALLKVLEEPPIHARLIVEIQNPSVLLPTLISRCQLVDLGLVTQYGQEELNECLRVLVQLQQGAIGQRFVLIDEICKTRQDALAWTDLALAATRQAVLDHCLTGKSAGSQTLLLRRLLAARGELSANVNPRLVLDHVFLS